MRIKSLQINNLRNIKDASIEPGQGLNFLIGDNGAGKTTVLESLVVLAKGRSFRAGKHLSLIGPDNEHYVVVAQVQEQKGLVRRLGLQRSAREWTARLDGQPLKQISDLSRCLPVVLLEPNSHALVSGSPDVRRRYLDWGVFHVEHRFLDDWRRYTRALRQRNAALRLGDAPMSRTMSAQLCQYGERVHRFRSAYMEALTRVFAEQLNILSPELGTVTLEYARGWSGDTFEQCLEQREALDMERGSTFQGPHRADLVLKSGGRLVRERFSRGEQKIVATALILAQAALLTREDEGPVVLLDDVSAEFDHHHLNRVLNQAMCLNGQIFISSVTMDPYTHLDQADITRFHVEQGQISNQ